MSEGQRLTLEGRETPSCREGRALSGFAALG